MGSITSNIVASVMIFWLIYELFNLVLESSKQKSYSIVYKVIISVKRYIKIKLLIRGDEFNLMGGIDSYGTLGHLLFILVLAIIQCYFFDQTWFVISVMLVIGTSLSVVLWDMMFWIGSSINLFFESLYRVVVNNLVISNAIAGHIEKKRVRTLIDKVEKINIGDLLPSFIARFVFIVILVVIGFAFEYMQLNRLDSLSLLDRSGNPITSYLEFLYQSVMLTTTFGTDMQPFRWGEFIIACHALVTLYLFVMVLAFFTALSENKLELEKMKFISNFKTFLKPFGEVK